MSLLHRLSLVVVVLSACASADDGWVNVGGRYLKFYATPMSFADAKSTCAKEGGVIAYDDHPLVNKHIAASGGVFRNVLQFSAEGHSLKL